MKKAIRMVLDVLGRKGKCTMCAARSDERRVTSDEWEVGSMKKAQGLIEGRNAAGRRIPQEECTMRNAQCRMYIMSK